MASSRTASVHAHSDIEKASPPGDRVTPKEDKPTTTLREDVAAAGLEAVYARHGRIDLVPMPSDDPEDPYNWPSWKKNVLLVQVAFHAMMGPFSAAAVIPSFEIFSEEFGVSITQASYLVSIVIIFIGVFPLLWAPVSSRIGRRPVLLGSVLIAGGCHLAGAFCKSYSTLVVTRVFSAIAISPPQSLGSNMVSEMFFQHEKGQKLGIWSLLVTLGPPLAPFFMGFLVYHTSWHWTFYLLAIINLAQFVLYLFLGPETLFERQTRAGVSRIPNSPVLQSKWAGYINFRRWSREPWSSLPREIVQPLSMFVQLPVLLPSIAYAIAFSYTNVLLTICVPSLLGRKYGLNAQQIGLQFIAPLIGALLGEPIAGWGSDRFVAWRTRKAGGNREPEFRLPFALPGFILAAVGLIVFGTQLQDTPAGVWSVKPLIGSAIALFGLQLITTVCYSYTTESQPAKLAYRVPLFVALVRQVYAFTAPFYLALIFEDLGGSKAGGLLAALTAGVGFPLVLLCLLYGKRWRAKND